MRRKIYELNDEEQEKLSRLKNEEGVAFDFWREVADRVGVDYKTIMIVDREIFTAMVPGENKHWCWPVPLKCQTNPGYYLREDKSWRIYIR